MAVFTIDFVPSPVAMVPAIPEMAIFFISGGMLGSFRPGVLATMSFEAEVTIEPVAAWIAEFTIWSGVFPVSTPDAMLSPIPVTAEAIVGLLMALLTSAAISGAMTCDIVRLTTAFSSAVSGGAPCAIDKVVLATVVPTAVAVAVAAAAAASAAAAVPSAASTDINAASALGKTPALIRDAPISAPTPPVTTAMASASMIWGVTTCDSASPSCPKKPPPVSW